jgi:hypothetical protein
LRDRRRTILSREEGVKFDLLLWEAVGHWLPSSCFLSRMPFSETCSFRRGSA